MATNQNIPKEVKPLIGTKRKLGGYLFSRSKNLQFEEYDILDWRFGSAQIMDMKTYEPIHPTFELLVKNDTMTKSRWTKPFPCRSIKI